MIKVIKLVYWWIRKRLEEILFCLNNYVIPSIPFWPLRKCLYKIQGMEIGKGSRILMKTRIVNPKGISIGEYTFINECCFLDGRSGIEIGSNTTVAIYTKLITGGHDIDDESFAYSGGKIKIGDHVAIFASSIVLGNVIIEDGCVFAAGSVVVKGQYKKLGVYAGNPAVLKRIRKCTLEYSQGFWHPIFR